MSPRAKREGWRSRAAFKLLEIDEKYQLLQAGPAHRRSWRGAGRLVRRWRRKRCASARGRGKVVGIDLLDIEPIAGVEFAVMDFLAEDAPKS